MGRILQVMPVVLPTRGRQFPTLQFIYHLDRESAPFSGMTLLVPEHSIPFTAREGTPQKEKPVVDWCSGTEKAREKPDVFREGQVPWREQAPGYGCSRRACCRCC